MKRIVEEVSGEGLVSLLGEQVVVWCECYIYTGLLSGVNDNDILLTDASVVYQTGELNKKGFEDSQPLGVDEWYVRISKIESYGKAL